MARGRSPSQKTRILVWGRAAGRCQYHGCGKRLDGDLVTGDLAKNHAYLAHIIASDPRGERGHPVLSHQLANDPDNLMLMCDPHHREIDDPAKIDRYTVISGGQSPASALVSQIMSLLEEYQLVRPAQEVPQQEPTVEAGEKDRGSDEETKK